jgi:N-acyl homoserine lactone hydrolase
VSVYSLWVVEYGYVDTFPASNLFAAQPNEGHRRMPYCFGVLRSGDRTILVDTGFEDAATSARITTKYGPTYWTAPSAVLERCGVKAEDVDTVILTHSHFDHAGCVPDFPNAQVFIQRGELDSLARAIALGPRFEFLARSFQADLADHLASRPAGTVTLADGEVAVTEEITAIPAQDTHTAGSQVVLVENGPDGRWLFAGDNVYSYENLEGVRNDGVLAPIAMTTGSATRWLEFADQMLTTVGGDVGRIIPFHEARLWDRYPSHEYDDGLHVAELSLAGGHGTVLPSSPRA